MKHTEKSKCARILDELKFWSPNEATMPELAQHGRCYNVATRISELRADGHDIRCRIERHGNEKHSFYRLIV